MSLLRLCLQQDADTFASWSVDYVKLDWVRKAVICMRVVTVAALHFDMIRLILLLLPDCGAMMTVKPAE